MHHCPVAAPAAHVRDGSARRVHHGFQIDVKDLVPNAHVHLERRGISVEPQHPGDVGEVIKPPIPSRPLIDGAGHERAISQIALMVPDRVAEG